MKTWIAFLRGINVGGKNRLPMKDLVAALEAIQITDVKTYIQSGNLVISCSKERAANLASEITAAIQVNYGFQPGVMVLSASEVAQARQANPFARIENGLNGKTFSF